jgi:hypothetical protein
MTDRKYMILHCKPYDIQYYLEQDCTKFGCGETPLSMILMFVLCTIASTLCHGMLQLKFFLKKSDFEYLK